MKNIETGEIEQNEIEVSIIVPSFNKYPLNLFTLYSLEFQSFDLDKMEVIMIDDGSTDQTSAVIGEYNSPFPFKFIKLEENQGRTHARKIGSDLARGDVLIFLDADILVDKFFVENHMKFHEGRDNIVVSGENVPVYTCVFPDFLEQQTKEVERLVKYVRDAKNRYTIHTKIKRQKEAAIELISKKDIKKELFKKLVPRSRINTNKKPEKFGKGLKGLNLPWLPWMSYATGNISLKKSLLQLIKNELDTKIENIYEEWEFGYLLNKRGATFIIKDEVAAFHQEHPESTQNTPLIDNKKHSLLKSIHSDIEVVIRGLEMTGIITSSMINIILLEYKTLEKEHPTKYHEFRKLFISLLETINILINLNITRKGLLNASGEEFNEKIQKELDEVKQLNEYNHLTELFSKLVSM